MAWTKQEQSAWHATYFELQAKGDEYYFCNANGLKRCLEEAQAGVERAETTWALYLSKRMTG
jgi:YHS domain-containing protein